MKETASFLGILLVVLSSSCHKDQQIDFIPDNNPNPENAKLKQVVLYANLGSVEPIGIMDEYEYDEIYN